MKKLVLVFSLLLLPSTFAMAADWPQYRADSYRSGYTEETLSSELALAWSYAPAQAPDPAWNVEDRLTFDRAYHTVIADGKVLFGSSGDCKVYALDAKTGNEVWSFHTDSPVRFAPAIWKDRAFAASDDGYVYCLSLADGKLLWKKRGGPDDDWVLGNDRMVSRWATRGGPVIRDDILYFGAGSWPSEGFYLFAVSPETGDDVWLNNDTGQMEMDQPHGGARAKSGVVAHGYLVATDDLLLTPTGRSVPAAFDREAGKYAYFQLQKNRRYGGSFVVATDSAYFNNGSLFQANNGDHLASTGPAVAAAGEKIFYYSDGKNIVGLDRENMIQEVETKDRKGNPVTRTVLNEAGWTWDLAGRVLTDLIVTGDQLVFAEADGRVSILDPKKEAILWSGQVEGKPLGLSAANGNLFVSADDGKIFCFGAATGSEATNHEPKLADRPYGENALYADAANKILAESGVKEGYCLDLGCGDGALAYELAKNSNLVIYAVDSDPEMVRIAREKLKAAGLYGSRVTVALGDPEDTTYPNYFADLAVSGRSVEGGGAAVAKEELHRLTRPYGGVSCVGKPESLEMVKRGPLEGAGEWTHQYSDASNTICSDDSIVGGKLGMLWFRDADQEMPQRHGRGPSPLFHEGRLIVEGMSTVRALDAYNGRTLWEVELPDVLRTYDQDHLVGTAATGSNLCVAKGIVYVRVGDRCLALDCASGKQVREFALPAGPDGASRTWGFLACVDDVLYGSISDTDHVISKAYLASDMTKQFSESSYFFALDTTDGNQLWDFTPQHSIRHNTISIGAGSVFLIDRAKAEVDLHANSKEARRGKDEEKAKPEEHASGKVYSFDAKTGAVRWSDDEDIFGTVLSLSEEFDVLLMSYQFTRFRQKSEKGGRMAAFRASTGERIWDVDVVRPQGYSSASRPILNRDLIYLEPFAYNLATGEKTDFTMERSYGCGIITSSANTMLFRSATLGYLDVRSEDCETINYGGVRPGCWINAIPAGGLVLMPDATAGCTCSYLNRASVALQPLN